MSSPYLISGNVPEPGPYRPPPGRQGSFRTVRILIYLWLAAGTVVLIWRFGPFHAQPAAPAGSTAVPTVKAISTEDLLSHVVHVSSGLDVTTLKLRRAEDQLARIQPSLDRNYLPLERQRLDNALSSTESARREVEQMRQEIDLILKSLKEHENR